MKLKAEEGVLANNENCAVKVAASKEVNRMADRCRWYSAGMKFTPGQRCRYPGMKFRFNCLDCAVTRLEF